MGGELGAHKVPSMPYSKEPRYKKTALVVNYVPDVIWAVCDLPDGTAPAGACRVTGLIFDGSSALTRCTSLSISL
jgi:hypothetical protein